MAESDNEKESSQKLDENVNPRSDRGKGETGAKPERSDRDANEDAPPDEDKGDAEEKTPMMPSTEDAKKKGLGLKDDEGKLLDRSVRHLSFGFCVEYGAVWAPTSMLNLEH
ncbi:hypothetical protein ANCDUO_07988 [Ancylostoma duodenale]|uniref:Uncharacterized protein n=1 Tax=Ancylostoma duodenale TaxID=51022 RepID=A0A0C2DH02_9BILA|nr:hypothetical protein ANCDUO_07988 [Ancylostoma duodenale]